LWQFKQAIVSHQVENQLKHCTIHCKCTETDVALAIDKIGATIVIKEEEN
jgi:hypothetical protein